MSSGLVLLCNRCVGVVVVVVDSWYIACAYDVMSGILCLTLHRTALVMHWLINAGVIGGLSGNCSGPYSGILYGYCPDVSVTYISL